MAEDVGEEPRVAIGIADYRTGLLQWYGEVGQAQALMRMPLYHDIEAVLWGGVLPMVCRDPGCHCWQLYGVLAIGSDLLPRDRAAIFTAQVTPAGTYR